MNIEDYNSTNANVTAYDVFTMLPIIWFMLIFIRIYYWIVGIPVDYDNYEPEQVLKMRYAKGEINSLEYLERMSRL